MNTVNKTHTPLFPLFYHYLCICKNYNLILDHNIFFYATKAYGLIQQKQLFFFVYL